jgi:hypothetical protein
MKALTAIDPDLRLSYHEGGRVHSTAKVRRRLWIAANVKELRAFSMRKRPRRS